MPKFRVIGEDASGVVNTIIYDSGSSTLYTEDMSPIPVTVDAIFKQTFEDSWEQTTYKDKDLRNIKIQLGLACNYDCGYCSQRLSRASDASASRGLVEKFLNDMPSWYSGGPDGTGKGTRIEFWGGEPLVYIKTLMPLAEGIRELYPEANFFIITNGSLITREITEWLLKLNFKVGLSHDGPGQKTRGPDPFEDPVKKEELLYLFRKFHERGKFDFCYALHKHNQSRAAISDFFIELTGAVNVTLSEGELISIYDAAAEQHLVMTGAEHFNYRVEAIREILHGEAVFANHRCLRYVNEFLVTLEEQRPYGQIPERCNTSKSDDITVDLYGNILSCQNFSAKDKTPSGESHAIGHITDLSKISTKSVSHWKDRPFCNECPMIQLCNGACMVTQGSGFEETCANRYSDSVVYFAVGIYLATGIMPFTIEPLSGRLPYSMMDIFGNYPHLKEKALNKHSTRFIPIQPKI